MLYTVSAWCDRNELDPTKTRMILFTKKRKIEDLNIPKIDIPITVVYLIKYLGIILDYRLNWIANLDSRIEIATIALWQCRKAYNLNW